MGGDNLQTLLGLLSELLDEDPAGIVSIVLLFGEISSGRDLLLLVIGDIFYYCYAK